MDSSNTNKGRPGTNFAVSNDSAQVDPSKTAVAHLCYKIYDCSKNGDFLVTLQYFDELNACLHDPALVPKTPEGKIDLMETWGRCICAILGTMGDLMHAQEVLLDYEEALNGGERCDYLRALIAPGDRPAEVLQNYIADYDASGSISGASSSCGNGAALLIENIVTADVIKGCLDKFQTVSHIDITELLSVLEVMEIPLSAKIRGKVERFYVRRMKTEEPEMILQEMKDDGVIPVTSAAYSMIFFKKEPLRVKTAMEYYFEMMEYGIVPEKSTLKILRKHPGIPEEAIKLLTFQLKSDPIQFFEVYMTNSFNPGRCGVAERRIRSALENGGLPADARTYQLLIECAYIGDKKLEEGVYGIGRRVVSGTGGWGGFMWDFVDGGCAIEENNIGRDSAKELERGKGLTNSVEIESAPLDLSCQNNIHIRNSDIDDINGNNSSLGVGEDGGILSSYPVSPEVAANVFALYDEMTSQGIFPTIDILQQLLEVSCEAGNRSLIGKTLNEYGKYGIELDNDRTSTLFDACFKLKQRFRAQQIFAAILQNSVKYPNWKISYKIYSSAMRLGPFDVALGILGCMLAENVRCGHNIRSDSNNYYLNNGEVCHSARVILINRANNPLAHKVLALLQSCDWNNNKILKSSIVLESMPNGMPSIMECMRLMMVEIKLDNSVVDIRSQMLKDAAEKA